MAQVTKTTTIGELLTLGFQRCSNFNGCWYALFRLSIFSNGVFGRGCYGSWIKS